MRSIRGIAIVLVVGTVLGGCIIRTRGRAHSSHSSNSTRSGPAVRDHRRNDPPPPPPPPPQPTVRDHR